MTAISFGELDLCEAFITCGPIPSSISFRAKGVNGVSEGDGKLITQSSGACTICDDHDVERTDGALSWRASQAVPRYLYVPSRLRSKLGSRPLLQTLLRPLPRPRGGSVEISYGRKDGVGILEDLKLEERNVYSDAKLDFHLKGMPRLLTKFQLPKGFRSKTDSRMC